MTRSHRFRLCLVIGMLQLPAVTMAASHLIFLGTYTRSTSKGIYAVRLDDDTGALSEPVLAAEAVNPTWLAYSPDRAFVYTIHASKAQAIGFKVDAANARLIPLPVNATAGAEKAGAPSHVAVDATGRVLMTANYGVGNVAAMAIQPDGTLGVPSLIAHHGRGPHPTRQEGPHVHSVTVSPDNRHVIVCDLGLDRIYSYAIDTATATLRPAAAPFVATEPGAGPRHFKFSADGRYGYAINELNQTITTYRYTAETGALAALQSVSTLPADFTGENTTSEIRIHPNGRFVYGANRGHDSIAVFSVDAATGQLSRIQIEPTGGRNPRNFALSPNGKWLVCGHQDTDLLTVFRVDETTGRLTRTEHRAVVPMCVCVAFHD